MEKDCSVCLIKNVKVGKHYGAVTCYSCRAFFRRSQDRKRPLRCKLSNSCEIGPDIGKSCPKCRYDKCLQVGMLPHLVLNEQEKNERFRTSRIKKALLNQSQAAASHVSLDDEDEEMDSQDLPRAGYGQAELPPEGDPLEGQPQPPHGGVSISYILNHLPSQPVPHYSLEQDQQVFQLKQEAAEPPMDDTMREWFISSSGEEEIIRKYLHKKFTKSRRQYLTEEVSDRGIMRKSVIVPNICYRKEEKKEEPKERAEEGTSSRLSQNFALMRNLNAQASAPVEEQRLNVIKTHFEQAWRSIDFGEDMVNDFILYCEHKQELPLSHWMVANKHFRERYIKFVCGLELTDNIPSKLLLNMLHKNLGKAQMMTYIFSFNLPCTEAIDFAYGANDLLQWQARDPSIRGIEFAVMLQNLSLPPKMKIEFISFLRDKLRPVLGDKTVYILLILLIVIEDEDEDHEVSVVRNIVMNHLIGYIQKSTANNFTLDLEIIKNCLQTLPALCNLFQAS